MTGNRSGKKGRLIDGDSRSQFFPGDDLRNHSGDNGANKGAAKARHKNDRVDIIRNFFIAKVHEAVSKKGGYGQ